MASLQELMVDSLLFLAILKLVFLVTLKELQVATVILPLLVALLLVRTEPGQDMLWDPATGRSNLR